jgi:hypothetical protein
MSGSREYPGAFEEVINSPPADRQRKSNGGDQTISLDDFYAHMPSHRYIFAPCRQLWPARSVNARLGFIEGIPASAWLDQNRHVEQMTWAPGQPTLIEDRLISEGGWIVKPGCRMFNLYRPPNIRLGAVCLMICGDDHSTDVATMPKNSREANTHDLAPAYEPTEHERTALKAFFARDEQCPPAPLMKVVERDGEKAFDIDHPNAVVAQVLLMTASICRLTIEDITSPGAMRPRRTLLPSTGLLSIAGTKRRAAGM